MFKKTKRGIKSTFNKFDIPEKNKQVFLIEDNGVSIFDVLHNINEKEKIEDIHIISFRISKTDLTTLENMKFDFKIKLLLSDSIPSMVKGTFEYLKDNVNFVTNYQNIHEKSAFIKTKENYYFLTSSGNFNPDGKIEFLSVFNSKKIYELLLPEIWKRKEKEEGMQI